MGYWVPTQSRPRAAILSGPKPRDAEALQAARMAHAGVLQEARKLSEAAIGLHLAYYNLVKTHFSIRSTPAMNPGVESSAWRVTNLVDAAA